MEYFILLPWFLFFPIYSFCVYIKSNDNPRKNIKEWIRENLIKTLRLDILLLITIFIYFLKYENETVNFMLFFMINLYLFVNTLYEFPKKRRISEIKFPAYIAFVIITLIPLIYYFFSKDFVRTCLVMFVYTFLTYFIVMLIDTFANYFLKKIKK